MFKKIHAFIQELNCSHEGTRRKCSVEKDGAKHANHFDGDEWYSHLIAVNCGHVVDRVYPPLESGW